MTAPSTPATVPLLLALDTATESLCLALVAGTQHHTHQEAGGAAASARLLPAVHELLQRAGHTLSDLHAIAFVRGPGAFTGLRTACAVAQGLAWGLDKPVLPLDALMLVAEGLAPLGLHDGDEVCVAMDARMDEAYAASYGWCANTWQVLQPPALYTLPALSAAWAGQAVAGVAGSALAAFEGRVQWPKAQRRVPCEADRAAALARLAQRQQQTGGWVAAAEALPLYLRDKVALTNAERAEASAPT
jgi:tRNA threonylcarbamoyladenosine biosynthesis protein TsaB